MTLVKVNNPIARGFDGLVNDFFNEFPSTFGKAVREDVFAFPPVNIIENKDAYNLQVSVPGWQKTDFSIKVDNNVLTLSAEKKEELKDENAKTIRKEFSYKAFKRSFTLDDKIDAANIQAKYENGILTLELPKKEEVKASAKEITVA